MDLEQALDHALDGDALLFTGAGFSVGAINLKSEHFKQGRELAKFLSKECGGDEEQSLELASEDFREQYGDDRVN